MSIVLEWSIFEVEAHREVRRCRGGLELVLPFRPIGSEAVVRFRIDTRELRPHVEVPRGEDEARAGLRAKLTRHGARKLPGSGELAKLPELAVHEVAGGSLRAHTARHAPVELRDGTRLLPQWGRWILRLAACQRVGVALEVVRRSEE